MVDVGFKSVIDGKIPSMGYRILSAIWARNHCPTYLSIESITMATTNRETVDGQRRKNSKRIKEDPLEKYQLG
jgi:hypothetical protein